jgi:type IV pilus assembly protein PilX
MWSSASKRQEMRPLASRQRGAALVVGLIMLLLLTLIGVAGMRDTLLQEKMAGNMRNREIALQAAETALKDGELYLSTIAAPVFPATPANGLYDLATTGGKAAMQRVKGSTRVSEQVFWQNWAGWGTSASSRIYSHSLLNGGTALPVQPRYVIERQDPAMTNRSEYTPNTDCAAGMVCEKGLVEVPDAATGNTPDYRITARGVGLTSDTVVILQSTFRRSTPSTGSGTP